jgi:hypothetical protein
MKAPLAVTVLAALALAANAAPAHALQPEDGDQQTPVQVTLPQGMTATTTSVMPGPTPDTKYVVINWLRLFNQSKLQPLNIDYKDFRLRAENGDFFDVDRKVTRSLLSPLSEESLGVGQEATGSLAFKVPATMRTAHLGYYVIQFDAIYPSNE